MRQSRYFELDVKLRFTADIETLTFFLFTMMIKISGKTLLNYRIT